MSFQLAVVKVQSRRYELESDWRHFVIAETLLPKRKGMKVDSILYFLGGYFICK